MKTISLLAAASLAVAACTPEVVIPTSNEVITSNAKAANTCAAAPISFNWNPRRSDRRLTAPELASLVLGQRVAFGDVGYEQYQRDGGFAFVTDDETFNGNGYVFYPDGSRCIAYEPPRYDLYVIADGKLTLINQRGGRSVVTSEAVQGRVDALLE